MQFRVDLGEPVRNEILRILYEQIHHARSGLLEQGASERAVHEARKACKRSRALVALVGSALPDDDRTRLDRALRDAARSIGPVRDADVMRRTLSSLGGDPNDDAPVPDREARGEEAVRRLDHARSLLSAQDLTHLGPDTLVEGLVASWRAARRTWDDADVDHHPEAFHEWRKAVKQLFYHVQLMHALDETVMGALAEQLDVLQEALGDHHDLHVLAEQSKQLGHGAADALRERATVLEERTLALGGWLLSAPSRQLKRWLRLAS